MGRRRLARLSSSGSIPISKVPRPLIGHDPNVPDATTEKWNGRRLDPPATSTCRYTEAFLSTSDSLIHSAFEFEFLLNESSDTHWILHRNPEIAVPLEQATILSPWGVPTATPEIILFFKADETLRPPRHPRLPSPPAPPRPGTTLLAARGDRCAAPRPPLAARPHPHWYAAAAERNPVKLHAADARRRLP